MPNRLAAIGSRELAAALINHFGPAIGGDYFNRGLTFDQANAEDARHPQQRGGFEAFVGRSRCMQNRTPPPADAPAPLSGFAAKLRLPSERRST
ncbi:MAG: hypothetical protein C0485_09940 [Pirellula sp.]|nr:hypothetical protein [Pirellula sp.]